MSDPGKDRDGKMLEARIVVSRQAAPAADSGSDEPFTLDVTIDIEPGTTVALLGPNGAGKSTTVEVLAGLKPLDDGRIALGQRVLDAPAQDIFVAADERQVGVVFQDYLLFDHLSVVDNVAFGPRSAGIGRTEARAAARRRLEQFDLEALADRRPSSLSGGQAQRVAMARALAIEPELLLLDEPLAAIDVATGARLRRLLIEHLSSFHGPRLLITHKPADAFVMADRLCVLENGRITQSGTAEEIRRKPATPYVAALAGTNFLTGHNREGAITVDRSDFVLQTSDTAGGPVQAVVHPRAISLYRQRPEGSPRNTWQTNIDWIEPLGETTRIQLGAPLRLMADITPTSAAALDLAPGQSIWVAVKATEVAVTPG